MRKYKVILLSMPSILFIFSILLCGAQPKVEWVWSPLFNGKDLNGWEFRGEWKVEDGIIVGKAASGELSKSYIINKNNYNDFRLRIKYQISGNSQGAVSFRSPTGIVNEIGESGYNVNIDPNNKVSPTGNICKIARAYEISEKSFPKKEWETLEICVEGDRIITIYNGKKVAEGFDRRSLSGKVAVQVRNGSTIKIKDIKILTLPKKEVIEPPIKEYLDNAPGEWKTIFNGKDFTGWRLLEGKATFKVQDECITAIPGAGGGWLFYVDEEFTDFIYKLKVKVRIGENSGIAYRYDPSHGRRLPSWFRSEVQVLGSDGVDVPDGTGAVYALSRNKTGLMKEGKWNEIAVYASGPHIATFVNGKKSAECYNWTTLKGFVGVSAHDKNTEAQFKDIEVKGIEW